uniref:Uncharacterized protein n=1 Tax=Chromera velia CCMP2878 TaxID=1169474 RepID=A0A0G4GQV9_9ALVE|eukprot:Cvel_22920.t1-p1 / transcript=Cvel_22920.t1 / gene=Cvel_22920 / organism=Chromera_velia_CCMP2878 / gene_product=Carboxypeptidase Y, putative / transcript_product=Carboxypeptidase Y, putative / location=Cvel_scaffold2304:19638-30810(-) / protein_length=436 / sequence_SO=supercontig / SO=protein_coding / is_pseudo=false
MVKSALEITEKNFNREEFSVPQVAILYGGDAAGCDFTLSAIEKQTPILVLQGSTSELFDAWLQILAYCHLRDADSGGDCIFPQLFKLMTIKGLEVMLVRRLCQLWHTGAVSFGREFGIHSKKIQRSLQSLMKEVQTMRNAILKEQASSFIDKKAILTVTTNIAEVTGPPTTPSDFVDIIKNITQLEAAFTEEAIVQMNQNFMETLIQVKGTAEEDSLTVGAGRGGGVSSAGWGDLIGRKQGSAEVLVIRVGGSAEDLASKVGGVCRGSGRQSGRVGRVEGSAEDLASKVRGVCRGSGRQSGRVGRVEGSAEDLVSKVGGVCRGSGQQSGRVGRVEGSAEDLASKVRGIYRGSGRQSGRVGRVEGSAEDLASKVGRVCRGFGQQSGRVGRVEGSTEDLISLKRECNTGVWAFTFIPRLIIVVQIERKKDTGAKIKET